LKPVIAKEVKEEILTKVKAGEPVSGLSKAYGVSDKSIYNWLEGKATKKVSWLEYAKIKKENEQLKEIIGVLSLEVAKSKKRQVGKAIEVKLPGVSKSLISQSLGIPKRNLYNQNLKQNKKDLILKDQILKVLEINPSYGHRRIAMELKVGKNKVRRVMRLFNIKPYKRKARWTKRKIMAILLQDTPTLSRVPAP
jgi:hypothetical protein